MLYHEETESGILLEFDAELWKARLSPLNIGDEVEAVGKIDYVKEEFIVMRECELVHN